MKLQLSLWAENLSTGGHLGATPSPFAVVTVLPKSKGNGGDEPSAKPVILGKTEVLPKTQSPDWTKLFLLDDVQLGKELHLIVSIYDGESRNSDNNSNKSLGSARFEVGNILGSPGSIKAKELRGGAILVAHLESAPANVGNLTFRLRAMNLINTEGAFRKPDPFYEIQRQRQSAKNGSNVWDTIFRSSPIKNSLTPIWPEAYLELHTLYGNKPDQEFRIVVSDFESSGKHVVMGEIILSLDEFVEALTEDAQSHDVSQEKALDLRRSGEPAGNLVVLEANVTKPELAEADEMDEEIAKLIDESETMGADESEDLVVEAIDLDALAPTFANYVAGGCELHVVVGIDATGSNGDPRQPSSLHYFEEKNDYQHALETLCTILAKYDSDQMYPVLGFGAKIDGEIDHCFTFGSKPEVEGVSGILQVYDSTFKSGIVMSSPRGISEVVDKATASAKNELESGHAYSVLLLFTNGTPTDMSKALAAVKRAEDAPLSIVLVGVGDGDFDRMKELQERGEGRDNFRFVHFSELKDDTEKLTEAALDSIPDQLVEFFKSRAIYPNPDNRPDEIVVEPYTSSQDIEVPIQINDNGEAVLAGEVKPPDVSTNAPEANNQQPNSGTTGNQYLDMGEKFMKKHKKQIGRVRRKIEGQVRRKIKQTFPSAKMFV